MVTRKTAVQFDEDDSSKPKEIPDLLKKRRMLHDIMVVHSQGILLQQLFFLISASRRSL